MKKFINMLVLVGVICLVNGCSIARTTGKPQVISASNKQTLVMQKNLGTFSRVKNPADGQATWEQIGQPKPSKASQAVVWLGNNWGRGSGLYAPRRSNITRVYGSSSSAHFSAHAGYHRNRTGPRSSRSYSHAGTTVTTTSGPSRSVSVRPARSVPTYSH